MPIKWWGICHHSIRIVMHHQFTLNRLNDKHAPSGIMQHIMKWRHYLKITLLKGNDRNIFQRSLYFCNVSKISQRPSEKLPRSKTLFWVSTGGISIPGVPWKIQNASSHTLLVHTISNDGLIIGIHTHGTILRSPSMSF